MSGPKFVLNNPGWKILAVEPRENMVGHVVILGELPNLPPIRLEIIFDRQNAQDFISKFNHCLDVAKGIKKINNQ